ncbi:MAG: hypothetical protein JO192_05845 [Candidatus Eremiobacteraeota bacterium]|nr:hypothetical protein [Candidatus Eremiobacteraeota bacterium]
MRKLLIAISAYAFLAAAGGCSANAPQALSPLPAGNAPQRKPMRALPPLHGVVDRDRYVIASDETQEVSANASVFAKDDVEIDGSLKVPQGVRVAFFTPAFVLHGYITSGDNGTPVRAAATDIISACNITIGPQSRGAGGGTITLPPGDALVITASDVPAHRCGVRFFGGLFMGTGLNGGKKTTGSSLGQKGGYIAIGSSRAVALTKSIAKQAGKDWPAYAPFELNTKSNLLAGSGGNGAADPSGSLSSGTQSFAAGNGGDGGDVEVTATNIVQFQPGGGRATIKGGDGGYGGGIGAGWSTLKANGTNSMPNALNIAVVEGGGGNGGDIRIESENNRGNEDEQLAGNGGSPGLLFGSSIQVGEGWQTQSTGGSAPGTGGSFTLVLGKPGLAGRGSKSRTPASNGLYPSWDFWDGIGGSGILFYQQGASGLPGAAGGSFTLKRPPGITGTQFATDGKLQIKIDDFGDGGAGGVGTCQTTPKTPGGNGANGGNLHDGGLMQFILLDSLNFGSSFDGGNGGTGSPSGTGGVGGSNDEGTQIGKNGTSPKGC